MFSFAMIKQRIASAREILRRVAWPNAYDTPEGTPVKPAFGGACPERSSLDGEMHRWFRFAGLSVTMTSH